MSVAKDRAGQISIVIFQVRIQLLSQEGISLPRDVDFAQEKRYMFDDANQLIVLGFKHQGLHLVHEHHRDIELVASIVVQVHDIET